jgi:hypothetical protein
VAVSAVVMAAGGVLHARAFDRTLAALADSNLAPFYANALKALWLADSATLVTLAAAFGLIAARPSLATRPVIMVLAVVPAATASCLYKFLGDFVPAHMLIGSALAALVGGLLWGGHEPVEKKGR